MRGASGGQPAVSLGPTGSGKTRVVEAMAEGLCAMRALVSRLMRGISALARDRQADRFASGYLGHRETHPLLTQEALNQWHTEKLKLSILCSTNRKAFGLAVAVAARNSGQSNANVG